jgi:crossover junction endodeoxyribonuclease RuvC
VTVPIKARYNSRTSVLAGATGDRPVVLGVDPGLTRTGWALVTAEGRRYLLVDAGVLAPRGGTELSTRLADGFRRFSQILEDHQPDLVVMEDIFTTPRFPKSALKMAHLRGVLCLAAALRETEVLSMTATTVKQRLTGNGHASKEQVQRMVFGLCDVGGRRVPNDLSDALAIAIAGLHQATLAARTGAAR